MDRLFDEAAAWVNANVIESINSVKGPEMVNDAVRHYLKTQIQQDTPMRELIQNSEVLQRRSGK